VFGSIVLWLTLRLSRFSEVLLEGFHASSLSVSVSTNSQCLICRFLLNGVQEVLGKFGNILFCDFRFGIWESLEREYGSVG